MLFRYSQKEDISLHLAEIKKKYYDASHHCFGWVLMPDGSRTRAADDGEPGHSAGTPILRQIKSEGLTDTLVVVVRYFGGTKLGIGGLIQAYKASAAAALKKATIVEKTVMTVFETTIDYPQLSGLMRLTDSLGGQPIQQDFTEKIYLKLAIRNSQAANFRQQAANDLLIEVETLPDPIFI